MPKYFYLIALVVCLQGSVKAQSFQELIQSSIEILEKTSASNLYSIRPIEKKLVVINKTNQPQEVSFDNFLIPKIEQHLSFRIEAKDTSSQILFLQNAEIYSIEINQKEYPQFWRPQSSDTIFIDSIAFPQPEQTQ